MGDRYRTVVYGGECCKNGIWVRMLEENVLVFPASVRRGVKLGNASISLW